VPLSEINRCQAFIDREIIQLSLMSVICSAQCCVENWAITDPAGFSMAIMRFRKIGKATLLKIRNVCLPVRVEQLCSHWTNLREISYLNIFRISAVKIQDLLKSVKK